MTLFLPYLCDGGDGYAVPHQEGCNVQDLRPCVDGGKGVEGAVSVVFSCLMLLSYLDGGGGNENVVSIALGGWQGRCSSPISAAVTAWRAW